MDGHAPYTPSLTPWLPWWPQPQSHVHTPTPRRGRPHAPSLGDEHAPSPIPAPDTPNQPGIRAHLMRDPASWARPRLSGYWMMGRHATAAMWGTRARVAQGTAAGRCVARGLVPQRPGAHPYAVVMRRGGVPGGTEHKQQELWAPDAARAPVPAGTRPSKRAGGVRVSRCPRRAARGTATPGSLEARAECKLRAPSPKCCRIAATSALPHECTRLEVSRRWQLLRM